MEQLYDTSRCLALAFGLLLLSACGPEKPKPDDPLVGAVDPTYEMLPPIASSVEVNRLKDNPNGNVLLVADMHTAELKGNALALNISTGTVVLRDDGKGGDETANDRFFSIALTEDTAALLKDFAEVEQNAKALQEEGTPTFRGREMVPFDKSTLPRMKMKDFALGGKIPIAPGLLCRLLTTVDPARSLFVTDLRVVEDPARTVRPCAPVSGTPMGAWTFGKLMENMTNGTIATDQFIRNWLNTWMSSVPVNGETVDARTSLFNRIILPWVQRSGGTLPITTANWMTKPLDPALAPFKLTAIVNRVDLRGNTGYGMSNAGEGRFVFEALTPTCDPSGPGGFTVIFEYGLPISNCTDLKNYARGWQELSTKTPGTAAYNDALQALTDVFARANAAPGEANGSALNQVRTNEVDLGLAMAPARPWELREFNIDATSHSLVLVDVKQEPAVKHNRQGDAPDAAAVDALEAWVNANATAVIADKHEVPLELSPGVPFRGGHALSSKRPALGTPIFWDGDPMGIINDDARHHFSLNTCTGCHGQEVNTPFLHVSMAPFGTEATLSPFLNGLIDWPDAAGRPAGSPTLRDFGDLARRRSDLQRLLCTTCIRKPLFEIADVLTFKPIHMTH